MNDQATTERDFAFMSPEAMPWISAKNAELRLSLFDANESLSDVHMELSAANLALSIGAERIAGLDKEVAQLKADNAELRTIVEQFAPAEVGEFCTWADAAREEITQKDREIERLKVDVELSQRRTLLDARLRETVAQTAAYWQKIAEQLYAVDADKWNTAFEIGFNAGVAEFEADHRGEEPVYDNPLYQELFGFGWRCGFHFQGYLMNKDYATALNDQLCKLERELSQLRHASKCGASIKEAAIAGCKARDAKIEQLRADNVVLAERLAACEKAYWGLVELTK